MAFKNIVKHQGVLRHPLHTRGREVNLETLVGLARSSHYPPICPTTSNPCPPTEGGGGVGHNRPDLTNEVSSEWGGRWTRGLKKKKVGERSDTIPKRSKFSVGPKIFAIFTIFAKKGQK